MEINKTIHSELAKLFWTPDSRMLYQDYVKMTANDLVRYDPHYQDWYKDMVENDGDARFYDVFYIGDKHEHKVLWKGHINSIDQFKRVCEQIKELQ